VYRLLRYHPDYSNNRVWRVFSLANPSAQLPMVTDADADDYPFSMPVDHLLSLHDVIAFNRDQYEGIHAALLH
jgi:dipeptidase